MRKRNVHSETRRLYLYMFSLSAALRFLSLWKIVYFENIFFYFPLSKDFPSCMKSQWRVRLIILLVCTSVPLVYLNVLWIIKGIKALGKRREVHRYREWTGSALSAGVTFSFHGNPLWGWCGPWGFCSSGHSWEDGLAWEGWVCQETGQVLAPRLLCCQASAWVVWIIYMPVLRTCRNLTGVLL